MDNKKYLKTKEGSIEQAVLDSLNTEAPINPNSLRPTLTLTKEQISTNQRRKCRVSGNESGSRET